MAGDTAAAVSPVLFDISINSDYTGCRKLWNWDGFMKKSVWNWVMPSAWAFLLAAEILFSVRVMQLDMLPTGFSALFFLLLVLPLGVSVLLTYAGRKNRPCTVRRIIACILCVLTIICCFVGAKIVKDLHDTMQQITSPPDDRPVRNVYVLLSDSAVSIQDAADYKFGAVTAYDVQNTQMAYNDICRAVGREVELVYFDSVQKMAEGLYDGQIDALILNGAYVPILTESEGYSDFEARTRVLYEAALIPEQMESEPTEPETTAPEVERDVTNTPFVVYFSGSDTRSKKLNISRSDVNIMAVVNPETKQILLINTPRDYYVENPAGENKLDKLTHCGIYGVDCSVKALENLYGLDIDYHAQINFTGFETLIDAVGGITVYSDEGFSVEGGGYISKGENTLNGKNALGFARERYRVAGGDNGRGKNQMKVIKAVIEKLTSGTTIIANYTQILESLEGMFVTSMEMSDISMLVKMQLTDLASWNILTYATVGTGGWNVTYSAPGEKLYVMYQNEDAVKYGSNLAKRVASGECLTQEDMALPKQ